MNKGIILSRLEMTTRKKTNLLGEMKMKMQVIFVPVRRGVKDFGSERKNLDLLKKNWVKMERGLGIVGDKRVLK